MRFKTSRSEQPHAEIKRHEDVHALLKLYRGPMSRRGMPPLIVVNPLIVYHASMVANLELPLEQHMPLMLAERCESGLIDLKVVAIRDNTDPNMRYPSANRRPTMYTVLIREGSILETSRRRYQNRAPPADGFVTRISPHELYYVMVNTAGLKIVDRNARNMAEAMDLNVELRAILRSTRT